MEEWLSENDLDFMEDFEVENVKGIYYIDENDGRVYGGEGYRYSDLHIQLLAGDLEVKKKKKEPKSLWDTMVEKGEAYLIDTDGAIGTVDPAAAMDGWESEFAAGNLRLTKKEALKEAKRREIEQQLRFWKFANDKDFDPKGVDRFSIVWDKDVGELKSWLIGRFDEYGHFQVAFSPEKIDEVIEFFKAQLVGYFKMEE